MESEADESSLIDNVDGRARLLGTDPVIVGRRPRNTGGGASTHSLNEADLQVNLVKLSNTVMMPLVIVDETYKA